MAVGRSVRFPMPYEVEWYLSPLYSISVLLRRELCFILDLPIFVSSTTQPPLLAQLLYT